MRHKSDGQLYLDWSPASSHKIVNEYREKFNRISDLLDANPMILDLAHEDLRQLTESRGMSPEERQGGFTSENLLRALIVHELEGTSFRVSCVRIAESETLRAFCRLGGRDVPDYSTIAKALSAMRPETWERIQQALTEYATEKELIDPSVVRMDTTVVESNIHYPTDASLLWDGYRVLTRLLREARDLAPELVPHRFHDRKVKKLYLFVTRYASSKSKSRRQDVKKALKSLMGHVRRIAGIAGEYCKSVRGPASIELDGIAVEIKDFLAAVRQVLDVAKRIHVDGESVPAREKVYSIFEQHVELIKRGKAGKPVEFGHKVLLVETREKFITDYQVLEEQVSDSKLTPVAVDRHEELFGSPPETLSADAGFWSGQEVIDSLGEKIETVAIPKNVRHGAETILPIWHRFRAGIEGTISVLKRAYRLMRCMYRGFKNFASAVGLGVVCHNLVCLANLGGT